MKNIRHSIQLAGCLLTLAALATSGHANLIKNGSFESGSYVWDGNGAESLGVGDSTMTGWTVISNFVAPINNANAFSISAEDGVVSLDLQGYSDGQPYGGVEQTVATVIGQQYQLQFYIGCQNSIGIGVGPVSIAASVNGGTPQTFTNSSVLPGQQWTLATDTFTATSTSSTIDLVGTYTQGGAYIGLDNVSMQAVPEPTSMLALGLGALGLLRRRKA